MRTMSLIKRNFKEIVRDPLTLIFAILLPVFLLIIFQQFDIPAVQYKIENFAPSIIIFGYSFITLFTAALISRDRYSSLLSRLYASPLKSRDYILGYSLALLPIALVQSILFFVVALFLGLPFSFKIIITILVSIPLSLLFIGLGLLVGSIVSDKAAAGVTSVVVQLVAFTSGMYFSVDQMGGVIKFVSRILPFSYCVDIAQASLTGNLLDNKIDLLVVILYTIGIVILSIFVFKKKMVSDNK